MEIIKTNIENLASDKKALYQLTKSAGTNAKDLEGEYPVNAYLVYEDENAKGEIQRVLTVLSDGVKIQSISKTFIDDFTYIADLMEADPFSIKIVHGKSKAGRDFVSCELVCD